MLRDSCYIWFVYNNINNWLIACTMQRNIVSSYYCRSFCPNLDFYIFFHYTCIRFRELIWNLYCSLIIKKTYQIWVLITMNKQKQKLILNDSCFFPYRVLPFKNSLPKFSWSYLAHNSKLGVSEKGHVLLMQYSHNACYLSIPWNIDQCPRDVVNTSMPKTFKRKIKFDVMEYSFVEYNSKNYRYSQISN